LRSILRQDPDVILVGEIRDLETARIATQAAQTGHLVLSTLHTDDAPSTITRLMDIGIESYVFASAAVGIVAQRLMRRLCQACRKSYTPPPEILRAMNISDEAALTIPFFTASGCDQCNQTGYKGRVGIYEVMAVTDKVRRMIAAKAPEDTIREAAQSAGMTTLGEDALSKVKAGLTTPEELLRVVTEVKEMRTACPSCAAPIAMDFIACPHCGKRISGACPGCARTLEPGWQFCPYCARTTDAPGSDRMRLPGKQRELPSFVAEFKTGVSG
jgi:Type II/IV secretion system protein/Double zinc ribbon